MAGIALSLLAIAVAAYQTKRGVSSMLFGLVAAASTVGAVLAWWLISRPSANAIGAELGASPYVMICAAIALAGTAAAERFTGGARSESV
jgi:hypothetical protein